MINNQIGELLCREIDRWVWLVWEWRYFRFERMDNATRYHQVVGADTIITSWRQEETDLQRSGSWTTQDNISKFGRYNTLYLMNYSPKICIFCDILMELAPEEVLLSMYEKGILTLKLWWLYKKKTLADTNKKYCPIVKWGLQIHLFNKKRKMLLQFSLWVPNFVIKVSLFNVRLKCQKSAPNMFWAKKGISVCSKF